MKMNSKLVEVTQNNHFSIEDFEVRFLILDVNYAILIVPSPDTIDRVHLWLFPHHIAHRLRAGVGVQS